MTFTQHIIIDQGTKYYYRTEKQSKKIIIFDDPFGTHHLWEPIIHSFHDYQIITLPHNLSLEGIQEVFRQEQVKKSIAIGFGQGNQKIFDQFEQLSESISAIVVVSPIFKTTRSLIPSQLYSLIKKLKNRNIALILKGLSLLPFKVALLKKSGIFAPYINEKMLNHYLTTILQHPEPLIFSQTPLNWKKLPCPTLLIAGDRDPMIPKEKRDQDCEQLLLVYGSRLAFWEYYDLSILRIRKFIRNHQL